MTRAVQWSRDALDDLKDQINYIAKHNPAAARRVSERVRATVAMLGEMSTGRPGRVAGTYEKVIVGLPYIVAYTVTPIGGRDLVSILRVIHAARDWPETGWP